MAGRSASSIEDTLQNTETRFYPLDAVLWERARLRLAPEPVGMGYTKPVEPGRLRVLIVDDNVDAADSLAMLVESAGHETQVAYDGPPALALAQTFLPQVVLLDLHLPAMDGYEVARRLRQQPETEQIVLAAVTGWGQLEDLRRSKQAGFDRHFVKPVEPTVILRLLSDAKAGGGRLPPDRPAR